MIILVLSRGSKGQEKTAFSYVDRIGGKDIEGGGMTLPVNHVRGGKPSQQGAHQAKKTQSENISYP